MLPESLAEPSDPLELDGFGSYCSIVRHAQEYETMSPLFFAMCSASSRTSTRW